MLRNLDEMIFLLRNTPDDRLEAMGRQFAGGWYTQSGRLDFFCSDIRGEIAAAYRALAEMPLVGELRKLVAEASPCIWKACFAQGRMVLTSLPAEMTRLAEFAARLWSQCDRIIEACPEQGAAGSAGADDIMRVWAIVCHNVRAAVRHFRNCERIFTRGPALDAPVPEPWTSIDVVIENESEPTDVAAQFHLLVEAFFKVPRRMPIREAQWGGIKPSRYSYHFEIPAMLLGSIRVGVEEGDPARERFLRGASRLAYVRIAAIGVEGTDANSVIEWRNCAENLSAIDFKDVSLS
jgi:hypothetical protein